MGSTVVVLGGRGGGGGRGRALRLTSRRGKERTGIVIRCCCRGAWTRGVMRAPVVVAVRVTGMTVPSVLHGVPAVTCLGGGGEQRLVVAPAGGVLPALGGLGRVV